MNFDTITIVLGAITLFIALIAPLFTPFFRFRSILNQIQKKESQQKTDVDTLNSSIENVEGLMHDTPPMGNQTTEESETLSSITILLTVQQQAEELQKHLPIFLSQEYNGHYQVVIVCDEGDVDTENLLKQYQGDQRLYYTFVPSSSRYMSRKKLAITIGVKAAKYDWIIMADANSAPVSKHWLQSMASVCLNERNLILGYSNYLPEAKKYYQLEHLYFELYFLRKAYKGTAYTTRSRNLAFRKSYFIHEDGFRGNLNLIRGEYDFIVNKFAKPSSTALQIDKNAWIMEDIPNKKAWMNKHLYYLETRKYLQRSSAIRFCINLDMLILYFSYLMILASIVYAILLTNWLLTIIGVVALWVLMLLHVLCSRKTMKYFLPHISLIRIIPFEVSIIWHQLLYYIRYKCVNKYDFSSHKL